jgi:hypothetical protein
MFADVLVTLELNIFSRARKRHRELPPTLRRASAAAMLGALRRTLRQAELDDVFLPFDVAQFAQSLPESGIGTSATSWSLRGDDRVYLLRH